MVKYSPRVFPQTGNRATHDIAWQAERSNTSGHLVEQWQATRMGEAARARNISYSDALRCILVHVREGGPAEASGLTRNSHYNTNPHPWPYDRTITTHPSHFHPSLCTNPHPPHQVAPMPREGMDTHYTNHKHTCGVGGGT